MNRKNHVTMIAVHHVACYTFIETPFSKNLRWNYSYYKANKNPQFQYSDPYLSDRLKEIWQPPKIG
jgi:hypothetical protein